MNNVTRHVRIGFDYFLQALKSRMEYGTDFMVECLASLLQQASGLLFLTFLFQTFHAVQGWSRAEIYFIYGFSLIPMAFFDAFSMSFYMFSDKYVVNGELDRILLRPLNSLFQLFMEGIGFDFMADLVLGISVLGYSWHLAGPSLTLITALRFAFCVAGAWGVLTGTFLALTAISFWSEDRLSFLPPVYNLLLFARYPLDIQRPFVRILLTWIIPFGFVAFYPSTGFFENPHGFGTLSAVAPFAGLVMLAIGIFAWRCGIRKYSGAGS